MKKILVPCDFSPPAQEAFRFAVNIALQNAGEIHVLYVIDGSIANNSNSSLSFSPDFDGKYSLETWSIRNTGYKKFNEIRIPIKVRLPGN